MGHDEQRPLRADETSDETEGSAHVPNADTARKDASPMTSDDREDPHPDAVAGPDDAGAQGKDRDNGGWGDRGIGGGRAGGTGL
ncbi:MAG: hypothetical protein ACXW61_10985 [Gemmatirosa sp.]